MVMTDTDRRDATRPKARFSRSNFIAWLAIYTAMVLLIAEPGHRWWLLLVMLPIAAVTYLLGQWVRSRRA